jgi:hypothetical protein
MREEYRLAARRRCGGTLWRADYTDADIDYSSLPETFWAYLAGLIDGEGSLVVGATRRTIRLAISNTSLPVLEEMAFKLGAIVKEKALYSRRRPSWEFTLLRANRVVSVLRRVYPYLRIKRWQAALAIMFLQRSGTRSRNTYDAQLLFWLQQANHSRFLTCPIQGAF